MEDGGVILPVGEYRPHPLADLFPRMSETEFTELREDIRLNGIREPLVLFDGQVLDGRHRYLAGRDVGATLPTTTFEGSEAAALSFVVSLNLRRRHLTESQRGMVAARIAKHRVGDNQHSEGPSIEEASKMMNVGHATTERARTVIGQGAPSLITATDAGEIKVSAAAEVARLPEPEQDEIVAAGPAAVQAIAAVQREDVPEEVKAAERATILAAAAAGLKPSKASSRKNPEFISNPTRDAALSLITHCRALSRVLSQNGPATLYAACAGDGERADVRQAAEEAAPLLSLFLEAPHVRAA